MHRLKLIAHSQFLLGFSEIVWKGFTPHSPPACSGLSQADKHLQQQRLSQLDRLYQKVTNALDDLLHAVGLKAA